MDYKIKINEALKQLEKLAGEGSTSAIRKSIEGETNQSKLFLKYQALREAINDLSQEKVDVSFVIQMPQGQRVRYANLKEFFEDEKTKKDVISYLKSKGPGKPAKA